MQRFVDSQGRLVMIVNGNIYVSKIYIPIYAARRPRQTPCFRLITFLSSLFLTPQSKHLISDDATCGEWAKRNFSNAGIAFGSAMVTSASPTTRRNGSIAVVTVSCGYCRHFDSRGDQAYCLQI